MPHGRHLHVHSRSPTFLSMSSIYHVQTKRSSSSNSKCTPGHDTPGCTFPTDNSATLPIALGVMLVIVLCFLLYLQSTDMYSSIPVACTLVAILFLTRRNRKRQKIEDANDKNASLDFGLGEVSRPPNGNVKKGRWGRGNKKAYVEPPISEIDHEHQARLNRGLSLDLGGSPYVLPPESEFVDNPRPSFTSLTRDDHDPYSPVTLVRTNSPLTSQLPSRSTSRKETAASVFTQSSDDNGGHFRNAPNPTPRSPEANSRQSLQPEAPPVIDVPIPAATMSRKPVAPAFLDSPPPESPAVSEAPSNMAYSHSFSHRPSPSREEDMLAEKAEQEAAAAASAESEHNLGPASSPPISPHQSYRGFHQGPPSTHYEEVPNNNYNFPTIEVTPTPPEDDFPPNHHAEPALARAPMEDRAGLPASRQTYSVDASDDYVTYADVLGIVQKESANPESENEEQMQGLGVQGVDYENKRFSASIRPLPPDDVSDNPETRANRIRSFYREYFDESKRDTALGLGAVAGAEYYEDYGQEYLDGAPMYDPETGQMIVGGAAPWAQPMTRRAMTPPPRAPPRYGGAPQGHRYYGSGQYGPAGGAQRPRGYSSASGAGFRNRGPRKPAEPPKPLTNLPTPYLLKDDAAIFTAIDFAPPLAAKDRAVGRPDSPFAEQRPYSPSIRAFTPLASPFDELTAMPSPHHLRKSGTFTALDFAPPPRLRANDGASDAGSIRSGRSNMSNSQLANIRAGAYRVSRIPKNFVGTRDDMSQSLRPTWDLRGPTPGSSPGLS